MSEEFPTNPNYDSRRGNRSSGSVGFAVVLILLGLLFLAQQIGDFSFENWWALFILIPTLSAFGAAARIWQGRGRFTFAVWSTFYGGLFPLLVAVMFLFNLDWGDYWPLFIILGGFGMFVGGFPFKRPGDENIPGALLRHRPWAMFIGLAGTLLGLTFLGFNLDLIETFPFFDFENWWGIYILIAALGGLVTALLLLVGRHSIFLVALNLAGAAVVAFTGVVALYNLNWDLLNLAFPILMILAGIWLIVGLRGRKITID
jgi:hypothetical protein